MVEFFIRSLKQYTEILFLSKYSGQFPIVPLWKYTLRIKTMEIRIII